MVLAISTEVFAAVSGLAATALFQLFVILMMILSMLMEAKNQIGEYHIDITMFSIMELLIAYIAFIEGAYGVASLIASVSAFTFAIGFVMYTAELYEEKKRKKTKVLKAEGSERKS